MLGLGNLNACATIESKIVTTDSNSVDLYMDIEAPGKSFPYWVLHQLDSVVNSRRKSGWLGWGTALMFSLGNAGHVRGAYRQPESSNIFAIVSAISIASLNPT
jgi:hypothetical protein